MQETGQLLAHASTSPYDKIRNIHGEEMNYLHRSAVPRSRVPSECDVPECVSDPLHDSRTWDGDTRLNARTATGIGPMWIYHYTEN